MRLALSVATVVVLLAATSNADEATHCPEPGTVVTYSDANSLTFTDQAGHSCRARSNKGGLVSQFLGLGFAEADLETYHVERLLPLRVGSQIDFMTTGTTANATGDLANMPKDVYYDNTITVARQEKLSTSVGTVDTFVIEFHRQVRGRWLGAWLMTSWFAPDLGATVRYKFETKQGSGNDTSYEIASIAPPRGNAATPARAASQTPPPAAPTAQPATPAQTRTAAVDTVKIEQTNGRRGKRKNHAEFHPR